MRGCASQVQLVDHIQYSDVNVGGQTKKIGAKYFSVFFSTRIPTMKSNSESEIE